MPNERQEEADALKQKILEDQSRDLKKESLVLAFLSTFLLNELNFSYIDLPGENEFVIRLLSIMFYILTLYGDRYSSQITANHYLTMQDEVDFLLTEQSPLFPEKLEDIDFFDLSSFSKFEMKILLLSLLLPQLSLYVGIQRIYHIRHNLRIKELLKLSARKIGEKSTND